MATTALTPILTEFWDDPTVLDAGDVREARRLRRPAPGPRHGAGRPGPGAQGLRPARPRRRGLPDRDEVGLPAGAGRRPALPGRQRRRVRAGHLQGHPADAGHAAVPDRGRDHHRLRDRLQPRLHLPARRGPARLPPAAAAVEEARAKGYLGKNILGLRLRPRDHRARRRGRLHLRRGDGTARLARGPPRPAAAQAAVPRRRRPLRPADRGQQRRVDRLGPARSCARAPSGSPRWAPSSSKGFGLFSLSGHVTRPGQYEAPLGITLRELLDMAGGMRDLARR